MIKAGRRAGRRTWREVLRWGQKELSASTVRKYYAQYRREAGLPLRCDNPDCRFYTEPLIWNGQPLRPIVDHKGGARRNNRPEALQYLCPNCNAQQDTHAGRNTGRIIYTDTGGGYARIRTRGRPERDIRLMAEPLMLRTTLGPAKLTMRHKSGRGKGEAMTAARPKKPRRS